MIIKRVMPCLLLDNHRLVKTVKFNNGNYVGDPINAVKIYNEKEVDEIIVLDIKATIKKEKINFNLIKEIASECFMPLTYGGGIKTLEDIKKLNYLGVEKFAINSFVLENPEFIKEASDLVGSQAIVVSIDVRKRWNGRYEVFTNSNKKRTKKNPVEWAKEVEKLGAGEILLTSIDKDGIMEGYDLELIKKVSENVNIPVIVCGGAGKIEDFKKASDVGASALAAGSMVVYQGKNKGVLINFPSREQLEAVLT